MNIPNSINVAPLSRSKVLARIRFFTGLGLYELAVYFLVQIPPNDFVGPWLRSVPGVVGDITAFLLIMGMLPSAILFLIIPLACESDGEMVAMASVMLVSLSVAVPVACYLRSPVPYGMATIGAYMFAMFLFGTPLLLVVVVCSMTLKDLRKASRRRSIP
jgi:hypothetical protein